MSGNTLRNMKSNKLAFANARLMGIAILLSALVCDGSLWSAVVSRTVHFSGQDFPEAEPLINSPSETVVLPCGLHECVQNV